MTEVLSQDEIDQLLAAINATGKETENTSTDADSRKIKIYDFKRPDKFSKEQIRTFSFLHETFARLTTTSLSAQLRNMDHVHVASVDQLTYEEFIRSIPTPTTLAVINMDPLKGNVILEIDPDITFSIIDRICGGTGEKTKSQHELSDIEQSIMENIIVRMVGNLREAWTRIIDLRPRLAQVDTNPQFVQIVPPNEMGVLITLETKVGDVEGMINIFIPYITVEPIIEKISIWRMSSHNNTLLRLSTKIELNKRKDVPVRLSAEILSRDYPIKEVLKWDTETLILPLRPLTPGYCYLRLGDRRVWQCQILPDCKWFPKKIAIVNYAEKPFGTEGNKKINEVNPLVSDALSSAMVKINVELGAALKTVKEVFAMGEGMIVELDTLAGQPLDVKANGILIATGEAVVIDENFGVRITEFIENPGDIEH
ncbi:flagellar motor switch protein FliM [Treponema sp. R8-4-B8]